MTYIGNLNQSYPGEPTTLVPAGARTAAGSGPGIGVGEASTLRVDLTVTAVAGTTPSLAVVLEHSPDNTTWSTHSTFNAVTAAGTQRKVASGLDRYIRCSWTITGTTPSATFSVAGELV